MSLKFCSIASGSSGNCYLVKTEETALLVDAGISAKRILQGLEATGTPMEKVKGILVTHEHIDHVRGIATLIKKSPWIKVYTNPETWDVFSAGISQDNFVPVNAGETFAIDDVEITTFDISHDAVQPMGYTLKADGRMVGIVTDTGIVTEEICRRVKGANLLVVEANHDVETLKFCKYPYPLKRRILGEYGHLSNEAAGELLCRLLDSEAEDGGQNVNNTVCCDGFGDEITVGKDGKATTCMDVMSDAGAVSCEGGLRDMVSVPNAGTMPDMVSVPDAGTMPIVLLAHLSKETNFPEMAIATVRNCLEAHSLYIGKHLMMEVILRDAPGKLYIL